MVAVALMPPLVVIVIIMMVYVFLGCLMDALAMILLTIPVFFPLAMNLGFDPIWFSILFILNMQVAYLTPPFGWALIMMKGVAPPEVTTRDIWRSVPPFVAIQLFVLILVMIFPQIAIWLPNRVF